MVVCFSSALLTNVRVQLCTVLNIVLCTVYCICTEVKWRIGVQGVVSREGAGVYGELIRSSIFEANDHSGLWSTATGSSSIGNFDYITEVADNSKYKQW